MALVVGAGPAGLTLARELLQAGEEVTVLEEHGGVGEPVSCSGVLSVSGLRETGFFPKKSVLNSLNGARFFCGKTSFCVERDSPQAVVVDRGVFDRELLGLARGADVLTNTRFLDFSRRGVVVSGPEGVFGLDADLVVGADGARSRVAEALGLWRFGARDFVSAFQAEAFVSWPEPDKVRLFFGSFAPGFFAWIIPLGKKRIRVGLGLRVGRGRNPRLCFDDFVSTVPELSGLKFENESGGFFPVCGPLPRTVADRGLLVGDAAGHVKATTGGGVVFGCLCAREAARALLGKNHFAYERFWRKKYARQLAVHVWIRNFLDFLEKRGRLEKFFASVKRSGFSDVVSAKADMDKSTALIRACVFSPLVSLRLFLGLLF